MRKANAKNILILLLTVLLTFCGLFVACEEEDPTQEEPFTLSKTELTLLVGESASIEANYTQKQNETLQFTSQAPSVATVSSGGVVTAVSVGETKVVARYGSQSAECKVIVEDGGLRPTINLLYGVEDSVNCYVDEEVNLSANVLFNGKAYEDATITYASSSEAVAEVEGEMLVPKTVGTTTVTITAQWRNFPEFSKQISVEVIDTVVCAVNDGRVSQFNLYTVSEFRGETYENTAPVRVSVKGKDETEIQNYTVSVVDESVATYDEGVLTAVGYGSTALKVVCNVNGKEIAFLYPVVVERPKFVYEEVLDIDSVAEFPVAKVFGDASAQILEVSDLDGKTELLVNENVISGFTIDRKELVAHTLVLTTATCVCEITVNPCTRVIRSFEDLQETFTIEGVATDDLSSVAYSGYYRLGGNVDCYGQKLANNSYKVFGLNGTFDGNGYVVSNLTCGVYGIFGAVNGGVVKNVAFTGVKYPTNSKLANMSLFGSTAKSDPVTYTDIYVEFAEETYDQFSSFTVLSPNRLASKSIVRNVVIDTSKVTLQLTGTKPSYGMYHAYYSELFNPDTVGTYEPTIQKNQHDIYLISKYYPSYAYEDSYGLRVIEAGNRKGEEINKFDVHSDKEAAVYYFETMKRYDTFQDFKAASGNNYESFDNSCWRMVDGVPLWNTAATWDATHSNIEMMLTDEPTTVGATLIYKGVHKVAPVADNDNVRIEPLGNGAYSVIPKKVGLTKLTFAIELDGATFSYEMNVAIRCEEYGQTVYLDEQTALPTDIFGAGERVVSAVDLDGSTQVVLSTDGTTLSGFTVNGKTLTTHEILLTSSANNYKIVKVIPVSGLITTYAQLTSIVKFGETVDGYYMLGSDIECSGTVPARSNNYKFAGTFDGNGYTVKNMTTQQSGLLGLMNGATVKNVAFTGVQYKEGKTAALVVGNISTDCIVENMYIQFAEQTIDNTYDSTNTTTYGQFRVLSNTTVASSIKYNNIVIDYSKVTLTDLYWTGVMGNDAAYIFKDYTEESAYTVVNHTNIYAIGKANLINYQNKNVLGGVNGDIYADSDDTTTELTMRHATAYRYDTVSEFATAIASADVSAFTQSGYWKVDSASGLLWK